MRHRLIKVKFITNPPPFPAMPAGAQWFPWEEPLVDELARATVDGYRGSRDADIWRELQDVDACAEWLRSRTDQILPSGTGVIRRGSETLATVITLANSHMPEVNEIFSITVAHAARGLGLGNVLIQISESTSVQSDVHVLKLQVDAENPRLVDWYTRLGYVTVEEKWVKANGESLSRKVAKALRRRLVKV